MGAAPAVWTILFVIVLFTFLLPFTSGWEPLHQDRQHPAAPPLTAGHMLGTDELGRDLWARYVWGARWSIGAGVIGTLATLLTGLCIGVIAAWFGRWADGLLMMFANVVLAVPWLFLLLALRSAIPLNWGAHNVAAATLAAVVLVSWPKPAQVIRSATLGAKTSGYVLAARRFGLPWITVVRRHIVPELGGVLLAQALVVLPRFVLADVTLGAFGLGIAEPDPSWGSLLLPFTQVWSLQREWWLALPALLMIPFFALMAVVARWLERGKRMLN